MRRVLWTLILSVSVLSAADVTGKWTGNFVDKTKAEGEGKSEAVLMILKQEGEKLTGSGGPNEGEQYPMQNGKVEGDKLTFEVSAGNKTIKFSLTAAGDVITGDMSMTNGGSTPEKTAKLSMKRIKQI
jgi:hypothetical protein